GLDCSFADIQSTDSDRYESERKIDRTTHAVVSNQKDRSSASEDGPPGAACCSGGQIIFRAQGAGLRQLGNFEATVARRSSPVPRAESSTVAIDCRYRLESTRSTRRGISRQRGGLFHRRERDRRSRALDA